MFKKSTAQKTIVFRTGLTSDIICDNGKSCSVISEFLDQCIIYVKDADHPGCDVPCNIELCKPELHLEMLCPVYICTFPDTTTTPASTTSSPGPLPPTPPSFPITPAKYATSVAFNVILTMVAVALALRLFKRQQPFRPIIRPRASTSTSFDNPTYREREENDPLLSQLGYRHPLDEAIALQNFEGATVRFDDPATFEPTAPPSPYSPPSANVQLQDVELGLEDNAPGAVAPKPEGASDGSSNSSNTSFFSGFDRWMRKKKKTQVRGPLTDADADIGRPDITDADL